MAGTTAILEIYFEVFWTERPIDFKIGRKNRGLLQTKNV